MLEIGKVYCNNEGQQISIMGRVKRHPELPYLWANSGDWYDEQTGAIVMCKPLKRGQAEVERYLAPGNYRSISNHNALRSVS